MGWSRSAVASSIVISAVSKVARFAVTRSIPAGTSPADSAVRRTNTLTFAPGDSAGCHSVDVLGQFAWR